MMDLSSSHHTEIQENCFYWGNKGCFFLSNIIDEVSQLCILRCFQKVGFKNELTNIDDSEAGSDDDELPLSCLVNIRNTLGEIGVEMHILCTRPGIIRFYY
jgi:hypothetical protein